ncbi:hypothetical protein GXW83_05685 [Streptacidiphilus sp. PB12-B1b]|uniref:hypothetical protein n=1 Tax=Streptacidiphilus sp. PB12-B1b TaxID=2705012 RepID=UPI0015F8F442|nr:hypothetical protein [Streptacidiphilus sp. PB12-B1b]QMU75322.1 hypothetical protein GXW83_05685 [Streptacidiphilus sp. PB12-B1b]
MSATLELLPGLSLAPLPPPLPRPAAAPGGGAVDPAREAAARFSGVAAAAVHPFEVAAAIEADGVTDRQVQRDYGRMDAFELAEELYADTPRDYPEPEPAPSPWAAPLSASLLRGLVYALPGLAFPLGRPILSGPADRGGLPHGTFALATSLLLCWGWNQGLAHRAHLWLGRGGRRSAGRCLGRGALAGALLGTVGALVAALLTGRHVGDVLLFCAGQSVYMGASCVLLVLGGEAALLGALAPAALGGAAVVTGLTPATAGLVPLLLCTLLLAVAQAVRALRACRQGQDADADEPPPGLYASLPHALFGLAMALLTLGTALRGSHVEVAPTVALTLSMGPAEWLLYGYRSRIHHALRAAASSRAFALRSVHSLLLGLGSYLGILAALGIVLGAALAGLPVGAQLLALLPLGAAVWTALLLQALGSAWLAAGICAPAAAATLAGAAETQVGGAAAVVLLLVACGTLGRATVHR